MSEPPRSTDASTDMIEDYSPSMVHWFGTPWPFANLPAPICEDRRLRIATPVDEDCFDCGEPIRSNESGVRMVALLDLSKPGRFVYLHAECQLRNVMCPVCLGLTAGPHGKSGSDRRNEGRILMQWSRQNAH